MHIGLFGGTFNPIHHGHLIIAESLLHTVSLDRIIFIPAAIPPHKQQQSIYDGKIRYEMINLAIQDCPEFAVSDHEIMHGSVSYTIDTVKTFQKKYTKDHLYLIIGADSLSEIHTWRNPEQLCEIIRIVVLRRPGVDMNAIDPKFGKKVLWIDSPLIEISSSQIRQHIRDKRSIRFLVPPSVEKYIVENHLYRES